MSRAATMVAIALCACAHAAPPPAPAPTRVWPDAPAQPLVRFVESFPRPGAPVDERPWWKRILEAIVGVDHDSAAREPMLTRPFGVAAVADGFLVVDPDRPAVLHVRQPDFAVTQLACAWKMPLAAASAPDGSIYVADGGAGTVMRILPDGHCLPLGAGVLERPSGVAVVADRVYAVDPPRHHVVAFSPEGREVLRFGVRGEGAGQLNFPTALAAGADGTLLVVDALNFRVARYRPDGSVVDTFGQQGAGDGAFGRPKGIAVDAQGRIFVSDAQNDVVLVFTKSHAYELAFGGPSPATGSLTLPAGVAVGDRFVYVADSYNHRVQVFELLGSEAR